MISDSGAMFWDVDATKLRFSLTLFETARPLDLITTAFDRWFGGERDALTFR